MKTTANNNKSHQELKGLSKKKIIAVTKKQTIEKVQFAIDCGIYKIGENQIQEAEKKFKKFKNRKKIELHFIGKLQSNKIKKAVYLFDVIQTVENKKQINKINKEAEKIQKIQKIYIQINISQDPKKNGITTKRIKETCKQIKENKNTLLCGVMTILKKGTPKEETFFYYKQIKQIQKQIQKNFPFCKNTSMGMSEDYKEAIKAGATEVRLGTLLFGKRKNEKN